MTLIESFCIAIARYALIDQSVHKRTWINGQWRSDEQLVTIAFAACCQFSVWAPGRWVDIRSWLIDPRASFGAAA